MFTIICRHQVRETFSIRARLAPILLVYPSTPSKPSSSFHFDVMIRAWHLNPIGLQGYLLAFATVVFLPWTHDAPRFRAPAYVYIKKGDTQSWRTCWMDLLNWIIYILLLKWTYAKWRLATSCCACLFLYLPGDCPHMNEDTGSINVLTEPSTCVTAI